MISKLLKKNEKGFTLMEMLIVVAIIAVLIAIAIPTFTASLNKAKVATDEANIRAGYASAMAELIAGDTDVADGTVLYLQKDGSVAATGANAYTCVGTPKDADEIAGQDKQPEEKIAGPERQCLSQAALENRAVKARGF